MENKRKIIGYKQPFDFENFETKKGALWVNYNNISFHHIESGFCLPKEIVEAFFEPVYEEVKLEDFKQITYKNFVSNYMNSPFKDVNTFIRSIYTHGVLIVPDNE